jgi:DNA-binding beta-propeller fold protein YncE
MRALVLAGFLVLAQLASAQPVLKSVQVAEFATGLAEPHDGAFSPDGKHIFLTDMRNSRMVVLEAMTLKLAGSFGDKELSYPHDAEFDKAGRLLVADTGNNRIAIYEVNGAQAKLVGELKGLAGPEGVAVAPDGRVIVTNTRNANLSVFRDGKLERTVGGYGSRDGEFANPHDVEAAADGSIWVVDSGNDRVQVFDAGFKHRASIGPAMKMNSPKYVAFDADRVWVADEYNHRILMLDRQGKLLGVLGTGKRGRSATEFYKPEAVLARAPHVWIIDTYNSRVVLLRVD